MIGGYYPTAGFVGVRSRRTRSVPMTRAPRYDVVRGGIQAGEAWGVCGMREQVKVGQIEGGEAQRIARGEAIPLLNPG